MSFFPDKHAGPDLVFFVVSEYGRRALVPLQSKLVTHKLQRSGSLRAETTTDVQMFYKFTSGKTPSTRTQQRTEILDYYETQDLSSIGILASYPARAPAETALRHDGRDLFIAACGESFKQLSPAAFADRIAAMKLDQIA